MKFTFTKSFGMGLLLISGIFTLQGINAQVNHDISVENNYFDPAWIKVTAGDTITWTNSSGTHNVNGTQETYPDNPESFGNEVGSNWTYSHIFTAPGEYSYQCDPHVQSGMFGHVKVVDYKMITLNFSGMTPHVGQDLWLAVRDLSSDMEVFRIKRVVEESFTIEIPGIETETSYQVDFYADLNQNGSYDPPATDHAWRINLPDFMADTVIDFTHNTDFTDIMWQHKLQVDFSGMDPHIGQDIHLAVIDKASGMEVGRTSTKAETAFSMGVYGIQPGGSYRVNFFADLSGNGKYDAPPVDHAWQLEVDNVVGDTTLNFSHNTDFTDINWVYKLSVDFMGMNPHIGQLFKLYLYDRTNEAYVDTIVLDPVTMADYEVVSYEIMPGRSYNIDFFADLNGNGVYDAPPTDHAWRMVVNNIAGDTTLSFTHNTSFTDIFPVETAISDRTVLSDGLQLYPNPARDRLILRSDLPEDTESWQIRIYNSNGIWVETRNEEWQKETLELDISRLDAGIYLLIARHGQNTKTIPFVKVE